MRSGACLIGTVSCSYLLNDTVTFCHHCALNHSQIHKGTTDLFVDDWQKNKKQQKNPLLLSIKYNFVTVTASRVSVKNPILTVISLFSSFNFFCLMSLLQRIFGTSLFKTLLHHVEVWRHLVLHSSLQIQTQFEIWVLTRPWFLFYFLFLLLLLLLFSAILL